MVEGLAPLQELVTASGPRVVTAAHPAAAAAGIAAFAAGGNAFDAALAACFFETVALPMKCGLAGDIVALYRRRNGPFEALLGIGPGPEALARGATLERVGPRSVGIPGAPHGYALLHAAARLGLDRLIAPAVRAAEAGIPWTPVALSYLVEADELLRRCSPGNPYQRGAPPRPGDLRVMPGLGHLLRRFAALGPALFSGEEGERLVAELSARGGILTLADLQTRPGRVLPAAPVALGPDLRLLVTPGPTAGPRLAEVLRAALAGGALPAVVRSERQEARRRGRLPVDGDTSVVTAADDEGNAVVVVHSNSFPRFGSGIVLESGLVLNNRPGRGFDLAAPANAQNAPAAGRVPQTTLHAWALEREGALFMGATPGGVNQIPWNAQTLGELLAGASITAAVTNPRWALDDQDVLTAEAGTPLPDGTAVARWLPRFSHRSVQQILDLASAGPHRAAADPRAGAAALAAY
jgi:gamma-glutamyltranspeptidase / glutathione hydrolase